MPDFRFYAQTDIGKVREANEDNASILSNDFDEYLLLMLDGMGGASKGDIASKLSLDFLEKRFHARKKPFKNIKEMKKWFFTVLKDANKYILDISTSSKQTRGMGTTLVGVLIKESSYVVANIGDSRCYVLKDNNLVQVTKDDSYINYLLENHEIDEKTKGKKYRNVLTNALGVYEKFKCSVEEIKDFDKILLCSDGLYNQVSDKEMQSVLMTSDNIIRKCQNLIDLANEKGGYDNIGVLICEVNYGN